MRAVWSMLCGWRGGAAALLVLACAAVAAVVPAPARAAAMCGTDAFDGAALDDARWDVVRAAGSGPRVAGGELALEIRSGDFIAGSATAQNVVLQDAPGGGFTATTTLDTAAIDENGEQAGIVLWRSEGPPNASNVFGKVVAIRNNAGATGFEAIWTDTGGTSIPTGESAAPLAPLPAEVTIRVRYDGEWARAEYRSGDTWTAIGKPAKYSGALRVGLAAMRGGTNLTGGDVHFADFALSCGPDVTVSASDADGTAPLEVDFSSTVSETGSELSWDFGDGATADGGATQTHTFTDPGTYRVRLSAEDADGNVTIGSERIVVRSATPAQPGTDEFDGNELDPKWEVLRPRLTGLNVEDGALELFSYGGDMHGGNASARNVLLQPLPPGAATVTTKIDVSQLTSTNDQVGMVLWRSEGPNNLAKVIYNRRSATTYWFERSRTENGTAAGTQNTALPNPPTDAYIRLRSSGGPNPTITPESSVDGTTWTAVGAPFTAPGSGPVKVGLVYMGASGTRVAAVDYFRVEGGYALPSAANPCGIDPFDGTSLDRTRWTNVVREKADSITVADGHLNLPALQGDLFGDRDTAQNLVLQDVPAGAWAFTTRLDSGAFDRVGQQAGVVIRKDGSTFDKIVIIDKGDEGRWFEHIYTEDQNARLEIGTDTTPPLPAGFPDEVTIRVVSDGETIRAEYQDGATWKPIGRPARIGNAVQVGLYAADNTQDGPAIPFDFAQLTPLSDEFDGDALDKCRWTSIVREDDTKYRVQDGQLELDTTPGEVQDDPNGAEAANLIGQPVPAGTWEAETEVDITTLANGQQAGLLLYRDSTNWIKAVLVDKGATSQIEFVRVKDGGYQLDAPFKVDVPSDLTRFKLRFRSLGTMLTAQYSTDGETWTEIGKARDISDLASGQLGPLALHGGAASPVTAAFDYVRVRSWTPPPAACTANGTVETGFTRLWNGVDLADTTQAGPGGFNVVSDGAEGCRLQSQGGLGMLWFNQKQYDNFVLRMQFKTADATDNSGVFVRFPNPGTDPNVAINQGHEIQIREGVEGDGENQKTGSIYNHDREDARAARPAGEWNDYEIAYENGTFTITLNGTVVNTAQRAANKAVAPGYIGIQNHGSADDVSFRNIRIQELASTQANLFDTIGITRSETRQNSQIYGNPTPYSLPAEEMPPSRTVGAPPDDDYDNVPLRMPDTSGNVPNLAKFNGRTLTLRAEDRKAYSKIHFFGTTTDGGPAGGEFVLRYSDDTTQNVRVDFRDWCGPQDSANHHWAIGPLSQRYRTTGSDGAQCGIYHVPADANPAKTLVSVTLPSSTTPASPNIQSYLMALTLEEPTGLFEMPDLSGQVQFPDDDEAPETTHELDPAEPNGNDGWYAGKVRVTLEAADEQGGSGVEQMMYRIDGGPPQNYGGPFDFPSDGEHTLEYRSIDGAGNAESYKAVQLKVDGNAPVTDARTSPGAPLGADGWFDSAVKLTLDPDDGEGSGTATTEYRLGGGAWQLYDAPVTLEQAGVYDVEYRSTDVAGNAEDAGSLRLRIDRTAPVTSARLNGAAPVAEYFGPVRVALTRTDGEGSGAVASEYRIGADGEWTDYTGAFDLDGLRGHRVDFRSRDLAGNVENFQTLIFVIRPAPSAPPGQIPPAVKDPAPVPDAFAALQEVADRHAKVRRLRKGKLAVRVSCQSVEDGTLRLTVSRKTARKLGLKGRTLAREAVRCGDEGRATVRLEPGRKIRRALKRHKGGLEATLVLRMGDVRDRAALDLQR